MNIAKSLINDMTRKTVGRLLILMEICGRDGRNAIKRPTSRTACLPDDAGTLDASFMATRLTAIAAAIQLLPPAMRLLCTSRRWSVGFRSRFETQPYEQRGIAL